MKIVEGVESARLKIKLQPNSEIMPQTVRIDFPFHFIAPVVELHFVWPRNREPFPTSIVSHPPPSLQRFHPPWAFQVPKESASEPAPEVPSNHCGLRLQCFQLQELEHGNNSRSKMSFQFLLSAFFHICIRMYTVSIIFAGFERTQWHFTEVTAFAGVVTDNCE